MFRLVKILKYAKPYWAYGLGNIISNILSILFSLVSFALFVPVLNILFKLNEAPETAPEWDWNHLHLSIKELLYYQIGVLVDTHGQLQSLFYIGMIMLGAFFFKNLTRYAGLYFMAPLRTGVVKDLRAAIYYKVLILPLSYFTGKRKGDVIARMSFDVQEVEFSVMSSVELLIKEPLTIIIFISFLFSMNAELTLYTLLLLPVSGIIIGRISKSLRKNSAKGQKKMGEILSVMEETIGGLRIIKAFTAIDTTFEGFTKFNNQHRRIMQRLYRKADLASPLSEFLSVGVVVVILLIGGRIVLSGDSIMDASQFILYIIMVSQILTPAKAISKATFNIQKGLASLDRIEQVLNAEEKIIEKDNALSKHDFLEKIEYRNVSFKYEDQYVLRNINLTIQKGKTIALVGASGSGKTTMMNLLPRFYDAVDGNIFIDNTNSKELIINDLRSLMGIVTQESILFNSSVKDNISFGKRDATMEEIIAAAKVANAHDFISKLPEGYDTNTGDQGTKLSGGQKQRISIARAVLANPPIMLLDEATSALDTESEKLVQEALDKLMKNRTSLIIAHRLSTIQHADKIIVMEDGKIVERGTHNNLLKLNGTYRKLCDLQSFA